MYFIKIQFLLFTGVISNCPYIVSEGFINKFQASVAFDIKTSHLGCIAKCKTELKWAKARNKLIQILNGIDHSPFDIYLLKVNNRNIRTRCEISQS